MSSCLNDLWHVLILGIGNTAQWLLSDQLSYAIGQAVLSCSSAAISNGSMVAQLFKAYKTIKDELGSADGGRSLQHELKMTPLTDCYS